MDSSVRRFFAIMKGSDTSINQLVLPWRMHASSAKWYESSPNPLICPTQTGAIIEVCLNPSLA